MLWFYESFFPVVWIFFFLYWQIKAANTKSTRRLEPAASRILRVFIFLIAIVLLSTTRIPPPFLYLQLWPAGLLPFWLGAAVTIAGLLFAVWAREHRQTGDFESQHDRPEHKAHLTLRWRGGELTEIRVADTTPYTEGSNGFVTFTAAGKQYRGDASADLARHSAANFSLSSEAANTCCS